MSIEQTLDLALVRPSVTFQFSTCFLKTHTSFRRAELGLSPRQFQSFWGTKQGQKTSRKPFSDIWWDANMSHGYSVPWGRDDRETSTSLREGFLEEVASKGRQRLGPDRRGRKCHMKSRRCRSIGKGRTSPAGTVGAHGGNRRGCCRS